MNGTRSYLIYLFIASFALIDMATTWTMDLLLSFGALLRPIVMLYLLIYIYQRKKIPTLLILIPYVFLGSAFLFHLYQKEHVLWLAELQFSLKTAYYVTILYFIYSFKPSNPLHKEYFFTSLQINSFILGVSYWIAIVSKSSLPSYSYGKSGYSGWFFAANELSVMILILLTTAILLYLTKPSLLTISNVVLISSISPMIGTKTALFGGLIILSYTFLYLIIRLHKRSLVSFSILYIAFLIGSYYSPAFENLAIFAQAPSNTVENLEQTEEKEALLSSRDLYLAKIREDYQDSPRVNKILGLGYAGKYHTAPKMIEMDFYDLFYSFGSLGTIILLIPLLLSILKLFQAFSLTFSYTLILGSFFLCLGISFVVGHVLFAPAVMSYMMILFLMLTTLEKGMKYHGRFIS